MYRIGKEELEAVSRVIESGVLFRVNNAGREVENFEKEWAAMMGTRYALCLSGGTSALISSLAGLGIGPGDEVIVPAYTFMATALAVLAVGAIPVIAEIDDTLTLDIADVERKMTPQTRAVIPVHINGFPADMAALTALAAREGFKIVEDCCQADGGSYQGKRLGTWGDAGAYSFNDFKILTAGEGGAIVTNDVAIYERALVYHDGGASFRPYAPELSIPLFAAQQYRVSEITGAILRAQLSRLEGILADLRAVKRRYLEQLSGKPGISIMPSHDIEGDCGTTLGLAFSDEAAARAFAGAEGVSGSLPIDSGKHVYSNWEPVLEHNISHHPATNPYNLTENRGLRTLYSADMCPRTLDILKRTVLLRLHPDTSAADTDRRIAACLEAVGA